VARSMTQRWTRMREVTAGTAGRARVVTGSPRRAARLGASVLAVVLAAGILASCASVRSDLGTADSNCFVDVASALHAVRHEGRLHGVRLVSVASLRPRSSLLYRAARDASRHPSQVCLVDFEGRFSAARVTDALGGRSGRYAVVEFGYPGRRLLGTLLVPKSPLPFGHPGA